MIMVGVRHFSTLLVMAWEVTPCLSRKLNSTFECRIMAHFTESHPMREDTHITILLKNIKNQHLHFVPLRKIPVVKVSEHLLTSIIIDFGPCEVNLVKIVDPV